MSYIKESNRLDYKLIDSSLKSFNYLVNNTESHTLLRGYSYSYFNFENKESRRAYIHPKAMDLLKNKSDSATRLLFCETGSEYQKDVYVAAIFLNGEWYGEFDKILHEELAMAKILYKDQQFFRFTFYAFWGVVMLILDFLSDHLFVTAFWGLYIFFIVLSQLFSNMPDRSSVNSYKKAFAVYNKDRIYKAFP